MCHGNVRCAWCHIGFCTGTHTQYRNANCNYFSSGLFLWYPRRTSHRHAYHGHILTFKSYGFCYPTAILFPDNRHGIDWRIWRPSSTHHIQQSHYLVSSSVVRSCRRIHNPPVYGSHQPGLLFNHWILMEDIYRRIYNRIFIYCYSYLVQYRHFHFYRAGPASSIRQISATVNTERNHMKQSIRIMSVFLLLFVCSHGLTFPYSDSLYQAHTLSIIHAQRNNYRYLGDILSFTPGLWIRDSGMLGQWSSCRIWGSQTNQVLLMVDGHPINDPWTGTHDLNLIPV